MWVRVEVWDEGPILNTFPKNLEDEWNLKKQIRKKKKKKRKETNKEEQRGHLWQREYKGLV